MPITRSMFRESVSIRNELTADHIELGTFKSDLKVIDVKNIAVTKGEETGGAIFVYEYKMNYHLAEPKNKSLGEIKIIGEIVFVDKASIIADIVSDWKKNKKIGSELMQTILNYALREAQIETIEQSKKVNLPLPVSLPRIKPKPKSSAS